MKKILLILIFVLSLCSCSYSATSDDIYVRKDVFEVEMRNINLKLDNIWEELKSQREEIKSHGEEIKSLAQSVAVLSERVDGNFSTLSGRIDGNFATLSGRIDGLEKRVDTTNTFLYYLLVLIGAMMILPFFNKWWENYEAKKQASNPSFTLDDVKRLIAEAKLNGMPQA